MKPRAAITTALLACLFLVGCGEEKSADIWAAAAAGDVAEIERHIAAGADINAKDPIGGSTPLITTSSFGHLEAAKWLIEEGAEVDAPNNQGNTALFGAAFLGHPEVTGLLIEKGADVNHKNSRGETPLDSVTGKWNQSLRDLYAGLGALLQTEVDIDRIERVRPEIAELIKKNGGEPNLDMDVWLASTTGHIAVVEKYLADGKGLEARDPAGLSTPLIVAAGFGQLEIAKLLISKGANLDAKNREGTTALHFASALCQREVVELLLEKGADASLKDNKGETALDSVSAAWSEEMAGIYTFLGLVLQHPLDVERIRRDRPEIAKLLRTHAGK